MVTNVRELVNNISFLISFALTWWKCLSTTVIHKAMVMGNFYLVASSILQRFVMSSQTNWMRHSVGVATTEILAKKTQLCN